MLTDDYVDSDDECELEEYAEPVERYDDCLYYPIRIGETLDREYRVEHKLGHGGFSTVWMAHEIRKKRDVALKIMSPGEAGEHELYMQDQIFHHVPNTYNLLMYEATFTLRGPRGHHRVLLFPMRGPSLASRLRQASMASRMSVAYQLLKTLASLHHSQIVHCGDLTLIFSLELYANTFHRPERKECLMGCEAPGSLQHRDQT